MLFSSFKQFELKTLKIIILFLVVGLSAKSQQYSNLRQKWIFVSDSVVLDTFSIIPESEIIRDSEGNILSDSSFHLDYSRGILYINKISDTPKQLNLTYRVFPLYLSKPYPEHPLSPNDSDRYYNGNFVIEPIKTNIADNSKTGIQVNGNVTRGISVGNNQNAVLNSNLNMQLTGELAPGLFIEANLSDKNIPVQPDGYSQQLQQFDQVYIRIYDSVRTLQMGDVDIRDKNSYFLRFNKRVLGGNYCQQVINISQDTKASTQVSAAVSKGNFSRNEFMGIEAVQGPYQLHGTNNERYVVVIAGTEKIYIDGVLLERGENADYVINYNTAELTFTPKHYISRNSRIIAEFEYSDKNYNRFLFYTKNQVKHKNQTYSIQYFTEGDAKNQPVNQVLTDEQKQVLATAGDDPIKAVVPNIDSVAFDKNRVRYKLTDTLVAGVWYDSVLVYSTNSDSAFYQAGFALVGENSGNYQEIISAVNGKVYQWIAPVNGVRQGNYEPVQLLIAPQKKQMLVASTKIGLGKNTNTTLELAYSEKNDNTFSEKQDVLRKGWAMKNAIENTKSINAGKLSLGLTYEITSKNFNPVERYKNAEFNRDWNLVRPVLRDEYYIQGNAGISNKTSLSANLQTEYLGYGSDYHGFRNSLNSHAEFLKFNFDGKASFLSTQAAGYDTKFYRHNISLSRPVWKLKLGAKHDFENNLMKLQANDSLGTLSRKYSQADAYISNRDSSENTFYLGYRNRIDYLPFNNAITPSTETNDIIVNTAWNTNKKNRLKTNLTWRDLNILTEGIETDQKNEQNLLGQIDHQFKSDKNLLNIFTFYELGTGLENRKEFSYLEVEPGQGIYQWIDYNQNSIPELNEFELSPFPEEANYIRIFTPTSDYIKVYSLRFNETLKIDPSRAWRDATGIKKLMSHFSNTFTYRVSHKHSQNDILSRLMPFPGYIIDTAQINRNNSIRNVLSFNRSHPKFGGDYTYYQQNQKTLITNGFDASDFKSHEINLRWNITSEIMLLNVGEWERKTFSSEFFSNKNYDIESTGDEFTFQWQPTGKFRTTLIYKVKNRQNLSGVETALLQEVGPEVKINAPKQGIISFKVSLIMNKYNGTLDNSVSYAMLEGYQPGENYHWAVNISRNLNNFLRLTLNYTGRKPADRAVIHTGQFSLSAYF